MCNSCEVLNIDGVNCHERGCPEARYNIDCYLCGDTFTQADRVQRDCPDCREDTRS